MKALDTFDQFQSGGTIVHRLDPRVKILAATGFIASNAVYPDGAWAAFALAWWLLWGTARLAKIDITFILKRAAIAVPFALAGITLVFTLPGQPVFHFFIGPWSLTASDAGLIRFASILLRSWLSVQAAILLTATTTFPDLTHALHHLRFPTTLIAIISFMYRFLFVLSGEAERLMRARTARSARAPDGHPPPLLWRAKVAGNMVGQLFIRSFERSERVYQAMAARGFQGQFLTFSAHAMGRAEWLASVISVGVLAFLHWLALTAKG